jgi:hypothetical protein
MSRLWVAALLFSIAGSAAGQEDEPRRARGDFGVRYWLSSGETKHSHNAQVADPRFGNPTSVLTYTNLDANALEVFARSLFERDWFVKGNLGMGRINSGWFRDEDFFAGQEKFSDTTSAVPEGWLAYGSLDLGRQWVLRDGAVTLGVFAGYGQWTEYVEAYGATDHLGFIGGDIPTSVKVISNKVIWHALRIGFAGEFAIASRAWLAVDLAAIPYTEVRNEDSHVLRTDPSKPDFLGPVPNIIHTGRGWGVQLDAEVRYRIAKRTELAVGFRYWYFEVTKGQRSLPNFPGEPNLPLVEFYSTRNGLTLALRRTW